MIGERVGVMGGLHIVSIWVPYADVFEGVTSGIEDEHERILRGALPKSRNLLQISPRAISI